MADASVQNLLARLAGRGKSEDGADPWAAIATTAPGATSPVPAPGPSSSAADDSEPIVLELAEEVTAPGENTAKLDELLGRIAKITGGAVAPASASTAEDLPPEDEFTPTEPSSLREARLTESEIEELILKYLLARGDANGRDIADQVKLPFVLVEELLRQLKMDQLVYHRGAAPMNDYQYALTDMGRERARRHSIHCTYYGSAPVSLEDYIVSVQAQTIANQHPTAQDLKRAFEDLLISPRMLGRLGPAINSGRGMFLYGAPGNGKTSIAERITKAFGQVIWIPRAIGIDGEIIRVFDPTVHEEMPLPSAGLYDSRKIDKRWVRIRRPTIVVGGELTMDNLEVTRNTSTGISEAPLQLKSNCGTLVIDDFGRQKMRTDELLNRWIVPLEKRYDFLNLANGKKIQVPFDQLVVFSTNLEPKDLVDDAFLRRIPYKIDVIDPSEEEFRNLFKLMAPKMGFEYREEPIQYLLEKHYSEVGRPYRCCHPRDLLLQVRNYCYFMKRPLELTNEYFDLAVENYFAVM